MGGLRAVTRVGVVAVFCLVAAGCGRSEKPSVGEPTRSEVNTEKTTTVAVPETTVAKTDDKKDHERGLVRPDEEDSKEPIVKAIIGKASKKYKIFGFKEVELGTAWLDLDKKTRLDWTRLGAPYAFMTMRDGDEEFVFSKRYRLVCYTKTYSGGPDDYLDKLEELFGKVDNERTLVLRPENPVIKHSEKIITYTFPEVVARVVFVKTERPIAGRVEVEQKTSVHVLDRRWMTGLLETSLTRKKSTIEWITRVAKLIRDNKLALADLPKLPGAEAKLISDKRPRQIIFFDHEIAKQKKRYGERDALANAEVATISETASRGDDKAVWTYSLAFDHAHYTPHDLVAVLNQDKSDSTIRSSSDVNGIFCTPFADFAIELNARLLRPYFPPKAGTLYYERPLGWLLRCRWQTKDGWKVECNESDQIILTYVGTKDL
jgi:hypothetical protein